MRLINAPTLTRRRRKPQVEQHDKGAAASTASTEETTSEADEVVSLEKMKQKMSGKAFTKSAPFHRLHSSILVDSEWKELVHDIKPTPSSAAAAAARSRRYSTVPHLVERRASVRPLQELPLRYHARVVAHESFNMLSFLIHGTPRWIAKLVRLLFFVVALLPAFGVFFCFYFIFSDRIALPYVTDKEKRTGRHYLDIYGSTTTSTGQKWNNNNAETATTTTQTVENEQLPNKPVVVFFTGGAWIIGYKMWGALMARALVPFGIMMVIPDYRNFPQTNVEGMIEDADLAVDWVLKNIQNYGGDPNKVVIAGQSAGAHIGACLLLRKAKMEAPPMVSETYRYLSKNDEITTSWHALDISGFIAVSGPYDLVEMRDILHQHGLDKSIVSAMFCNDVARYSPTVMIHELCLPKEPWQTQQQHKKTEDDLATIQERVQMHLPPTCVIHGQIDKTVPFEISMEFFDALKRLKIQQPLEFKLYPSWSHTDPILEAPFAGNHLFHREVYELVKVWTATSQPGFGEDGTMGKDKGEHLLPFDDTHPACRKICPLWLVQIARFCNPF